MNGTATPQALIVDKGQDIDPEIEELEKIVAPAVNAYLWVD